MKKRTVLSMLLTGTMVLGGCTQGTKETANTTGETAKASEELVSSGQTAVNTSELFSDRDLEIGYDEDSSALITLDGDSVSCDSDAVEISGSSVTVKEEGTYLIRGSLTDGMIIVEAEDTDKVQLVLDGAEITSASSAAIYVREADKVFVTTAADTENTLSNGGEYAAIDDNNIDSVIFSKADLTLNGAGTLNIEAEAGHGIVSKDDLVLTSGTCCITAADHGISGKDSVSIAGGTFTIVSGKDGIHAENTEDETLGALYIGGGVFDITSEGDGLSGAAYVQIEEGSFVIKTGGGSAAAAAKQEGADFAPGKEMQEAAALETATEDSTVSTKGVKASSELVINGGSFEIDSADDCLHANGNVSVNGGELTLSSGDDGLHADSAAAVTGGSVDITKSYEGIEGLTIDISGGDISLIASDDGLNAAGGNDSSGFGGRGGDMFAKTEGACITISGGTLRVNASGDGIDSNGDFYVTGGETYVSGPTNSGNGSLDYNGEAVISGGIFGAAGASGMAQSFGDTSTQGVMMVNVESGAAGSTISLRDSGGGELVAWQADKEYSSVIVSSPDIKEGSVYTLIADGAETEITMDSLVYGSDGAMNGGGMRGGPGNGQEMPGGGKTGRIKGEMPQGEPAEDADTV